jgi:hypothetical protein
MGLMKRFRRRPDRLESNDEILLRSQDAKGRVKVRVVFQLLDSETHQYVGYRGKGLVFTVHSPAVAGRMVDAAKNLFLNWRPE